MKFLTTTWNRTIVGASLSLENRLHVPSQAAAALLQHLCRAYQSPMRHYHNLQHLQQMLTLLETIHLNDRACVTLAVWFHDAVCNARRGDNEEKSAQWAVSSLLKLGIPTAQIDRISYLILATQSHHSNTEDPDCQALLDCDLSILGTPPDQYQTYALAIRQEYHWVSDDAYRTGRSRVLQQFLGRDRIYHGRELHACETRARQNLTTELATLAGHVFLSAG